jgi:hypothetical protein
MNFKLTACTVASVTRSKRTTLKCIGRLSCEEQREREAQGKSEK